MKLTLRLTSEAFSRYEHGIISLGTLLDVFVKSDLLMAAAYDDPAGWYARVEEPLTKALIPIAHDLYAFNGVVQETRVEQDGLDIYYDVLVDCGLPISLLLTDLEAKPGEGNLGQHVPDPGVWLSGLAHLSIDWADQETLPVGQALAAAVVGIDRLILRLGPGFGALRSEGDLSFAPLAPDQIYLTLRIAGVGD